jgi:LuxR family quorum sensing-dependent transcriptional regulator
MANEFDDTLHAITRLNAAASVGEVCATLLDLCSDYGIGALLGGFIPDAAQPSTQARDSVIMDRWPLEWAQRYFARGYIGIDPAISAVRNAHGPFGWSDLKADDEAQQRVLDEAGDFGLRHGVTVPLHPLEGGIIGLSLAGERLDLPPRALGKITLLATYAIGQTLLLSARRPAPDITPRQLEVLKWLVAGKTTGDIAAILGIADDTANNHVRALHTRFGVSSRAQLVAEALRLRLVE